MDLSEEAVENMLVRLRTDWEEFKEVMEGADGVLSSIDRGVSVTGLQRAACNRASNWIAGHVSTLYFVGEGRRDTASPLGVADPSSPSGIQIYMNEIVEEFSSNNCLDMGAFTNQDQEYLYTATRYHSETTEGSARFRVSSKFVDIYERVEGRNFEGFINEELAGGEDCNFDLDNYLSTDSEITDIDTKVCEYNG
jgi:hypothetical protein